MSAYHVAIMDFCNHSGLRAGTRLRSESRPRFGSSLDGTFDVLNSHTSNPVSDFEKEIAGWPVNQAKIALRIVSDILKGHPVNLEERASELTFDQFRKVDQLLRRIYENQDESASVDDQVDDVEDDSYEHDDIERRAQRYHDQIDAQIEASYRFLRETFGEGEAGNFTRRYSLRTLSVFAVHIATLVAIARDFPQLDRATLNGFTRTLSFRTENTMPDVEPPAERSLATAVSKSRLCTGRPEYLASKGWRHSFDPYCRNWAARIATTIRCPPTSNTLHVKQAKRTCRIFRRSRASAFGRFRAATGKPKAAVDGDFLPCRLGERASAKRR
jgi:hypothetical protein